MIGVSLPFKWLKGESNILGNVDEVLLELKNHNVKSIEIRTIRAHHNADDALRAANLLWDHGFSITVHSYPTTLDGAVDEVFLPLKKLIDNLRQEQLTIIVHPINDDNVAMLNALADYRDANGFPVTIALENNRLLPDKTEGDATALIFDAVKRTNREKVGICFDMGHYMYYRKKNFPNEPIVLPSKDFFKKVVHTHIHAINGLTTHYPIDKFELPLDEMIYALYMHYYGVYNLELDFPRLSENFELLPALLESVDFLDRAMPNTARLFDDIRLNFDSKFLNALKTFEKTEGTYLGLVHSTSYLFSTNGFNWAMDIAFRNANELAKTPSQISKLFDNVNLMILSHDHRDHFEELTICRLANNDMTWLVPDFLYDRVLSLGVPSYHIVVARDGESVTIGPLQIHIFKSLHFRVDTGRGTEEYGYLVTSEQAPSMAFPGDIRDFSIDKLPVLPEADYCIAHVWLGDGNSFANDYGTLPETFSKFMLHFSTKNIILTHLYENGRRDSYMWRQEHANIIRLEINKISPSTNVLIPNAGELINLFNT